MNADSYGQIVSWHASIARFQSKCVYDILEHQMLDFINYANNAFLIWMIRIDYCLKSTKTSSELSCFDLFSTYDETDPSKFYTLVFSKYYLILIINISLIFYIKLI